MISVLKAALLCALLSAVSGNTIVIKIAPAHGPAGGPTPVTVTGKNFPYNSAPSANNAMSVKIGKVDATGTYLSTTTATFTVPPGFGIDLPIRIFKGTEQLGVDATPPVTFSYDRPVVTDISPTSLTADGVNTATFTITGKNFGSTDPASNGGLQIQFLADPCPSPTWVSDTQLTCKWSDLKEATKAVVFVTVAGQTSFPGWPAAVGQPLSGQAYAPPVVVEFLPVSKTFEVLPASGPTRGGNRITVRGEAFVADRTKAVIFNNAGTQIGLSVCTQVVSPQTMIAVAPWGIGKDFLVKAITNTPGVLKPYTSTISKAYYFYSAPCVDRLVFTAADSVSGRVDGNLTGKNFGVNNVSQPTLMFTKFPGTSPPTVSVTWRSDKELTFTFSHVEAAKKLNAAPSVVGQAFRPSARNGTSPLGDAVLTVADQTNLDVSIYNIHPKSANTRGGSQVTIDGCGFGTAGAATVQFPNSGTTGCIKWISSERLIVTVPSGYGAGDVTVTVTSKDADGNIVAMTSKSSASSKFSYNRPEVYTVSPLGNNPLISTAAGFTVTIRGRYFGWQDSSPTISIGQYACDNTDTVLINGKNEVRISGWVSDSELTCRLTGKEYFGAGRVEVIIGTLTSTVGGYPVYFNFRTPRGIVLPTAPTQLKATSASPLGSLLISWGLPLNTGSAGNTDTKVLEYRVQVVLVGRDSKQDLVVYDRNQPGVYYEARVIGLAPRETYSIRVAAINAANQGAWARTMRTVPDLPAAPSISSVLVIPALDPSAILVRVVRSIDTEVTQYVVTATPTSGVGPSSSGNLTVSLPAAAALAEYNKCKAANDARVATEKGNLVLPNCNLGVLSSVSSDIVVNFDATQRSGAHSANGVSYTVSVVAIGLPGQSSATVMPNPIVVSGAPLPVKALSVTQPASDTSRLSWSAPPDIGYGTTASTIAGYEINVTEVCPSSQKGRSLAVPGGSTTSYDVPDLTPGCVAAFSVRVKNTNGYYSDAVQSSGSVKVGAPAPVRNLTAPVSAQPSLGVALTWTLDPSLNASCVTDDASGLTRACYAGNAVSSPIVNYSITWSTDSAFTQNVDTTTASNLTCDSKNACKTEIFGLAKGQSYFFRVRARNDAGLLGGYGAIPGVAAAFGQIVAVAATVPSAPTEVVLENVFGETQLKCSWKLPTDTGDGAQLTQITGFIVQLSNLTTFSDAASLQTIKLQPEIRSMTFDKLQAQTTYFCKVAAINAVGPGPYSDNATAFATADAGPAVVAGFSVTGEGADAVLSWARPAADTVTRYVITTTPIAGSSTINLRPTSEWLHYSDSGFSCDTSYGNVGANCRSRVVRRVASGMVYSFSIQAGNANSLSGAVSAVLNLGSVFLAPIVPNAFSVSASTAAVLAGYLIADGLTATSSASVSCSLPTRTNSPPVATTLTFLAQPPRVVAGVSLTVAGANFRLHLKVPPLTEGRSPLFCNLAVDGRYNYNFSTDIIHAQSLTAFYDAKPTSIPVKPVVLSMNPAFGLTGGAGSFLELKIAGFQDSVSVNSTFRVTFRGNRQVSAGVSSVALLSSGVVLLRAGIPIYTFPEEVTVRVEVNGISADAPDKFIVVNEASATEIEPSAGPVTGGTLISVGLRAADAITTNVGVSINYPDGTSSSQTAWVSELGVVELRAPASPGAGDAIFSLAVPRASGSTVMVSFTYRYTETITSFAEIFVVQPREVAIGDRFLLGIRNFNPVNAADEVTVTLGNDATTVAAVVESVVTTHEKYTVLAVIMPLVPAGSQTVTVRHALSSGNVGVARVTAMTTYITFVSPQAVVANEANSLFTITVDISGVPSPANVTAKGALLTQGGVAVFALTNARFDSTPAGFRFTGTVPAGVPEDPNAYGLITLDHVFPAIALPFSMPVVSAPPSPLTVSMTASEGFLLRDVGNAWRLPRYGNVDQTLSWTLGGVFAPVDQVSLLGQGDNLSVTNMYYDAFSTQFDIAAKGSEAVLPPALSYQVEVRDKSKRSTSNSIQVSTDKPAIFGVYPQTSFSAFPYNVTIQVYLGPRRKAPTSLAINGGKRTLCQQSSDTGCFTYEPSRDSPASKGYITFTVNNADFAVGKNNTVVLALGATELSTWFFISGSASNSWNSTTVFTIDSSPYVSEAVPPIGLTSGGEFVTITAGNLGGSEWKVDDVIVRFGRGALASARVASIENLPGYQKLIRVVTPAVSAAGQTEICLSSRSSPSPEACVDFTYSDMYILPDSVSPTSGPSKGGTVLTLVARYLRKTGTRDATVFFGSQEGLVVHVDRNPDAFDESKITIIVPPHPAAKVKATLTIAGLVFPFYYEYKSSFYNWPGLTASTVTPARLRYVGGNRDVTVEVLNFPDLANLNVYGAQVTICNGAGFLNGVAGPNGLPGRIRTPITKSGRDRLLVRFTVPENLPVTPRRECPFTLTFRGKGPSYSADGIIRFYAPAQSAAVVKSVRASGSSAIYRGSTVFYTLQNFQPVDSSAALAVVLGPSGTVVPASVLSSTDDLTTFSFAIPVDQPLGDAGVSIFNKFARDGDIVHSSIAVRGPRKSEVIDRVAWTSQSFAIWGKDAIVDVMLILNPTELLFDFGYQVTDSLDPNDGSVAVGTVVTRQYNDTVRVQSDTVRFSIPKAIVQNAVLAGRSQLKFMIGTRTQTLPFAKSKTAFFTLDIKGVNDRAEVVNTHPAEAAIAGGTQVAVKIVNFNMGAAVNFNMGAAVSADQVRVFVEDREASVLSVVQPGPVTIVVFTTPALANLPAATTASAVLKRVAIVPSNLASRQVVYDMRFTDQCPESPAVVDLTSGVRPNALRKYCVGSAVPALVNMSRTEGITYSRSDVDLTIRNLPFLSSEDLVVSFGIMPGFVRNVMYVNQFLAVVTVTEPYVVTQQSTTLTLSTRLDSTVSISSPFLFYNLAFGYPVRDNPPARTFRLVSTPAEGSTVGKTVVELVMAGWPYISTSGAVPSVSFGSVSASSVYVRSSTLDKTVLVAVTPSGLAGDSTVVVTDGFGSTATSSWKFTQLDPVAAVVYPNTGDWSGGYEIFVSVVNLPVIISDPAAELQVTFDGGATWFPPSELLGSTAAATSFKVNVPAASDVGNVQVRLTGAPSVRALVPFTYKTKSTGSGTVQVDLVEPPTLPFMSATSRSVSIYVRYLGGWVPNTGALNVLFDQNVRATVRSMNRIDSTSFVVAVDVPNMPLMSATRTTRIVPCQIYWVSESMSGARRIGTFQFIFSQSLTADNAASISPQAFEMDGSNSTGRISIDGWVDSRITANAIDYEVYFDGLRAPILKVARRLSSTGNAIATDIDVAVPQNIGKSGRLFGSIEYLPSRSAPRDVRAVTSWTFPFELRRSASSVLSVEPKRTLDWASACVRDITFAQLPVLTTAFEVWVTAQGQPLPYTVVSSTEAATKLRISFPSGRTFNAGVNEPGGAWLGSIELQVMQSASAPLATATLDFAYEPQVSSVVPLLGGTTGQTRVIVAVTGFGFTAVNTSFPAATTIPAFPYDTDFVVRFGEAAATIETTSCSLERCSFSVFTPPGSGTVKVSVTRLSLRATFLESEFVYIDAFSSVSVSDGENAVAANTNTPVWLSRSNFQLTANPQDLRVMYGSLYGNVLNVNESHFSVSPPLGTFHGQRSTVLSLSYNGQNAIGIPVVVAAAPSIVSASYDESYARVLVAFDMATDFGGFLGSSVCSSILDTSSYSGFGTGHRCDWQSPQLLVISPGFSNSITAITILPLVIRPAVASRSQAGPTAFAASKSSIRVSSTEALAPIAIIEAPQRIGRCNNLVLKATPHPLAVYLWACPNDLAVDSFLKRSTGLAVVTIPPALLSNYGKTYHFTLRVSPSSNTALARVTSFAAPILTSRLVAPAVAYENVPFFMRHNIEASLCPTSADQNLAAADVSRDWIVTSANGPVPYKWPGNVLARGSLIYVPAQGPSNHKFSVTSFLDTNVGFTASQTEASFRVVSPAPAWVLFTSSRHHISRFDAVAGQNITSLIYSSEALRQAVATGGVKIVFSCSDPSGQPCLSLPTIRGDAVSLNSTAFVDSISYLITVELSGPILGNGRAARASIRVKFFTPTGKGPAYPLLKGYTGSWNARSVSASENIALLDPFENFELQAVDFATGLPTNYTWSFAAAADVPSISTFVGSQFVVPTSLLAAGHTYTVMVSANSTDDRGSATFSFVIGSGPTSGGCTATLTAPERQVVVVCSGFADSGPLSYEYGLYYGSKWSFYGQTADSSATLCAPSGSFEVWVRVRNADGAATYSQAVFTTALSPLASISAPIPSAGKWRSWARTIRSDLVAQCAAVWGRDSTVTATAEDITNAVAHARSSVRAVTGSPAPTLGPWSPYPQSSISASVTVVETAQLIDAAAYSIPNEGFSLAVSTVRAAAEIASQQSKLIQNAASTADAKRTTASTLCPTLLLGYSGLRAQVASGLGAYTQNASEALKLVAGAYLSYQGLKSQGLSINDPDCTDVFIAQNASKLVTSAAAAVYARFKARTVPDYATAPKSTPESRVWSSATIGASKSVVAVAILPDANLTFSGGVVTAPFGNLVADFDARVDTVVYKFPSPTPDSTATSGVLTIAPFSPAMLDASSFRSNDPYDRTQLSLAVYGYAFSGVRNTSLTVNVTLPVDKSREPAIGTSSLNSRLARCMARTSTPTPALRTWGTTETSDVMDTTDLTQWSPTMCQVGPVTDTTVLCQCTAPSSARVEVYVQYYNAAIEDPGCDGVKGSGKVADVCGICPINSDNTDTAGRPADGSFCKGCDGVANSGKRVDACGTCGGDNSTCAGCDGMPSSGVVLDACGVCAGDNSSCMGCNGTVIPLGGLMYDQCGVCGGNSSSCAGCDGIPWSGKKLDKCMLCGGNSTNCFASISSPREGSAFEVMSGARLELRIQSKIGHSADVVRIQPSLSASPPTFSLTDASLFSLGADNIKDYSFLPPSVVSTATGENVTSILTWTPSRAGDYQLCWEIVNGAVVKDRRCFRVFVLFCDKAILSTGSTLETIAREVFSDSTLWKTLWWLNPSIQSKDQLLAPNSRVKIGRAFQVDNSTMKEVVRTFGSTFGNLLQYNPLKITYLQAGNNLIDGKIVTAQAGAKPIVDLDFQDQKLGITYQGTEYCTVAYMESKSRY